LLAQGFIKSAASFFNTSQVVINKVTPGPCSDGSVDVEIACEGRVMSANFSSDARKVSIYSESPDGEDEKIFELEKTPLEARLRWLSGSSVASVALDQN
jgi:hypothetical protein